MLLVVYDIHSDRLRTRLSKYLEGYGSRIQYSVFEIRLSERFLRNILSEMKSKFEKHFSQDDSVLVFKIPDSANILRFGYPKNEENDLILV